MDTPQQDHLGDELFGTRLAEARDAVAGPEKGEFVPPPDVPDVDERADALPEQEEFWRPPVRFGSVPVESTPLGWDRHRGFRKLYPQVMLPTQVVERVSFGHPELKPNRLFWGDNLHVMRQLPSECIDLIYIDPPFFSGRQYNVIFGDQNELRSFTDIWEGGMPGYLIWLNARLYEMKRLLKRTGSIYVHLDWHAAQYVKQEMDKIFGYANFRNQVIWAYGSSARGAKAIASQMARNHDVLLVYARGQRPKFSPVFAEKLTHIRDIAREGYQIDEKGRVFKTAPRGDYTDESVAQLEQEERIHWTQSGNIRIKYFLDRRGQYVVEQKMVGDVWSDVPDAMHLPTDERLGYPTQKPERLMERVILLSTSEGDTVADFFCGGGTTPAVAQRLSRRWIACDQSRVAVAITADRLARAAEQASLDYAAPDFTVEHWGIYEAKRLAEAPPEQFREFVLRAFGAVPDASQPGIHGHKGAVPVWVGQPAQASRVTAQEVQDFANAVRRTLRYQQDNLRDGIMLAWAFRSDAVQAAERLREQEATDLNFIRLDLIAIDRPRFREHIQALSTDRADYSTFLTFVQPPRVEVGWKKLSGLTYRFDVSETVVLNAGAKIINVQWDFDFRDRFTSTQGYSFVRTSRKQVAFQVDYTFSASGRRRIACKVQDDAGGEGVRVVEIEVK